MGVNVPLWQGGPIDRRRARILTGATLGLVALISPTFVFYTQELGVSLLAWVLGGVGAHLLQALAHRDLRGPVALDARRVAPIDLPAAVLGIVLEHQRIGRGVEFEITDVQQEKRRDRDDSDQCNQRLLQD